MSLRLLLLPSDSASFAPIEARKLRRIVMRVNKFTRRKKGGSWGCGGLQGVARRCAYSLFAEMHVDAVAGKVGSHNVAGLKQRPVAADRRLWETSRIDSEPGVPDCRPSPMQGGVNALPDRKGCLLRVRHLRSARMSDWSGDVHKQDAVCRDPERRIVDFGVIVFGSIEKESPPF
jgi:hypothetical protein